MAVEGISCGSELPSLAADGTGVFLRASLPAVPVFRGVSSCVFCPPPNWNICFTAESPELSLCSGTNPSLGYVLANIFIRSAGSLAEHKLGELARLPRCRPIHEHAVSLFIWAFDFFYQHSVVFSMQFCPHFVTFSPKCLIFQGDTIAGVVSSFGFHAMTDHYEHGGTC